MRAVFPSLPAQLCDVVPQARLELVFRRVPQFRASPGDVHAQARDVSVPRRRQMSGKIVWSATSTCSTVINE